MFGNVDWRARLLLVLGSGLILVGAVFVRSLALPLAFVGLAVIIAGGFLNRYLTKRAPGARYSRGSALVRRDGRTGDQCGTNRRSSPGIVQAAQPHLYVSPVG